VIIAIQVLWAYSANDIIWTAVGVGALGGLAHEISQSKGTAFLPDTASSGQNGGKAGSKDNESYLGGLLGIILGGAAGFLTLSAVSASTTVSVQFAVTAFSAGAAFKGIADAAASPSKPNTTNSPKKNSQEVATEIKDAGAADEGLGAQETQGAE
jgi:MFS-type transporter involved in bile tolerance (Atg22 family)